MLFLPDLCCGRALGVCLQCSQARLTALLSSGGAVVVGKRPSYQPVVTAAVSQTAVCSFPFEGSFFFPCSHPDPAAHCRVPVPSVIPCQKSGEGHKGPREDGLAASSWWLLLIANDGVLREVGGKGEL